MAGDRSDAHGCARPRGWPAVALALTLAGCGGGGGGGGGPAPASAPTPTPTPSSGWVSGQFLPASTYGAQCAAPRTGANPQTGLPYPDQPGTVLSENNWLRSWSNDLYLWYDEIVDRDPGLYATAAYFDFLKTSQVTPSGAPKDKFHFTYDTDDWVALSRSGVAAGYGAEWSVVANLPPRQVVVAYTQPGSPATQAGADLKRGEVVLEVDGVDVVGSNVAADVDRFVAGLYPNSIGETHVFTVAPPGGPSRSVTMQSAAVTIAPVQHAQVLQTAFGRVGYVSFTDHVATSEQALVDAFTMFKNAPVDDVVLDLRYNGGGYLAIAGEVAYMIAGDVRTAGQTFERLAFNAKHPSIDPVTGDPLDPLPFPTQTIFSAQSGQPLPTLNLPRVFVLTGSTTCSASESIINSLRGVNVEVIQIGSKTCGKPYGFYPQDNCGTTYFTIEFKGVNAAGFGDYTDGFAPNNAPGTNNSRLPGCQVRDDFSHELGDPAEARFAAALDYRVGLNCPAPSSVGPFSAARPGLAARDTADGVVHKTPWLENRSVEHVRQ